MRRKPVEMDGCAMAISPLTMAQVEEHLRDREAVIKDIDPENIPQETMDKLNMLWRKFVCYGLNNAQNGSGGEPPWTPERVLHEIDLLMFAKLRADLLEFSGLKQGEVKAAQTS